jgi:hypothetical protein
MADQSGLQFIGFALGAVTALVALIAVVVVTIETGRVQDMPETASVVNPTTL